MRKIFIATLAALSILLMPLHGYAAPGGGQGPDDQAREKANDNASFKRDQQDMGKKDKKKNKDKNKDQEGKKDTSEKSGKSDKPEEQKEQEKKKDKKKNKDKSDKSGQPDKSGNNKDQDK